MPVLCCVPVDWLSFCHSMIVHASHQTWRYCLHVCLVWSVLQKTMFLFPHFHCQKVLSDFNSCKVTLGSRCIGIKPCSVVEGERERERKKSGGKRHFYVDFNRKGLLLTDVLKTYIPLFAITLGTASLCVVFPMFSCSERFARPSLMKYLMRQPAASETSCGSNVTCADSH